MTTQDIISENERELKRLEIRGLCEDDPRKRSEIRKQAAGKRRLLTKLRKWLEGGINRADLRFYDD